MDSEVRPFVYRVARRHGKTAVEPDQGRAVEWQERYGRGGERRRDAVRLRGAGGRCPAAGERFPQAPAHRTFPTIYQLPLCQPLLPLCERADFASISTQRAVAGRLEHKQRGGLDRGRAPRIPGAFPTIPACLGPCAALTNLHPAPRPCKLAS